MTRRLAALTLAAIGAASAAVVTGLGAMGFAPDEAPSWLRLLHAGVSCLAGGLAVVLAASAFLLGLRGLLASARGPRLRVALLFFLGPAVMAAVVGSVVSGFASHRDPDTATWRRVERSRFVARHAVAGSGALLVGLGALALALRGETEDEADEEP